VKEGARVLYVAGEDCRGVAKDRLPANCRARGFPLSDIDEKWLTVPASPHLRNADELAAFIAEHRRFCTDIVVIDTLAMAAPGEDINAPGPATAIMSAVQRIGRELNADVILIGHPNKRNPSNRAQTMSEVTGSGYFMNNADAALELTFHADRRILEVYVRKMKNGKDRRSAFYRVGVAPNEVPLIEDMTRQEQVEQALGRAQPQPGRQSAKAQSKTLVFEALSRLGFDGVTNKQWYDENKREAAARGTKAMAERTFNNHRGELVTLGEVHQQGGLYFPEPTPQQMADVAELTKVP